MEDDSLSAPARAIPPRSSPSSPEDAEAADAVDAFGDASAPWKAASAHFVRWRDGEARAIDELVRLMTPVLWHVVRAYGLRPSVAEDVIQSTWLALVRAHATIENPAAVSGWLVVTARREAWRASRADRRADPVDDELLESRLPHTSAAETHVERDDANRRLWDAVRVLDERCQRLLRIVAFDDRPDYARIASDLHMPLGSIGPTRKRCLEKLRARLEDADRGPERGA